MSNGKIKYIEFNNYKTLMEKVVTEGWESWWQEVEERLSKITSHKEEYLAKLKTNTSNMAVFMVLYNKYVKEAERRSVYSFVKDEKGFVSDEDRKKYTRTMNDIMDMRYEEMKHTYPKEKIDEHLKQMKDGNYTIAAYQKLQLEIMGDLNRKSSIITRIAKGKFCNGHNYTNSDAEDDIKNEFGSFYKRIDEKCETEFEKCVQYYQLENSTSIEGVYNMFRAAKAAGRKGEKLKEDAKLFYAFYVYIGYSHKAPISLESQIIMRIMFTQIGKLMNNMKLYSQLYEENPDELTKIILINHVLNMILKFSVFNIEEWLKVREISIVYAKDDRFFKDFLGEGQHITKNKDFENDVKIGQMRKFYKHYTPKEISSILSKAF